MKKKNTEETLLPQYWVKTWKQKFSVAFVTYNTPELRLQSVHEGLIYSY